MEYKLERLYEAARLEKESDWNQTLDFCQKWVELEPLNCIAWQGVGDAYRKLGQPEKAIEAYRKGIEIAPSPPVELFGRSLSSARFGISLDMRSATWANSTRRPTRSRRPHELNPVSLARGMIWASSIAQGTTTKTPLMHSRKLSPSIPRTQI